MYKILCFALCLLTYKHIFRPLLLNYHKEIEFSSVVVVRKSTTWTNKRLNTPFIMQIATEGLSDRWALIVNEPQMANRSAAPCGFGVRHWLCVYLKELSSLNLCRLIESFCFQASHNSDAPWHQLTTTSRFFHTAARWVRQPAALDH